MTRAKVLWLGVVAAALLGATDAKAGEKLASRLLENPANTVALAKSLLAGRIKKDLGPQILTALRRHAPSDSSGQTAKLLNEVSNRPD